MNILIEDVSVTYQPKTPFQYNALKNITTEFSSTSERLDFTHDRCRKNR